MKEFAKRKTMRLQCVDYNSNSAIFLTICAINHRCILSRVLGEGILDVPKIELTQYGKIADKYIRQLSDFYMDLSVESYVIMPNHIHIMLRIHPVGTGVPDGPRETDIPDDPCETGVPDGPRETDGLNSIQNSIPSRFLSTFKRFCNKECGENIWQYRSYDHIIRDQADYERHLRYIFENPIRWQSDELYPKTP